MGIPGPPAQTLATLIFDGVLERFPDLRIGVIEQGAIWVPSWTRQMESAFDAFARHEERLQNLSLRPSEYVRRQVRFTPYPTEDVGWIIDQSGPEVCLFSSDYPHVEGGRRPIERFEASLAAGGIDPYARQRFYCRQLPRPDGRRPAGPSPPDPPPRAARPLGGAAGVGRSVGRSVEPAPPLPPLAGRRRRRVVVVVVGPGTVVVVEGGTVVVGGVPVPCGHVWRYSEMVEPLGAGHRNWS